MRYHWQSYESPLTVTEALALLHEHQGHAKLLAGGTDLLIDLDREDVVIPAVVDITNIHALQEVREEGEYWEIGAAVTLSQVLHHQALSKLAPHLMEAIEMIGSVQIRNAATLVGNVTNASPAADSVLPLLTMDAEVVIASTEGQRALPLKSFFIDFRSTACGPEEMVIALRVPKTSQQWIGAFEKLGLRQAMAIAVVNVAASVAWNDGKVADMRLALGAVAPTPLLVEEAQQSLLGSELEEDTIAEASSIAKDTASPISDVRAGASYRADMTKALTVRCLQRIRVQRHGKSGSTSRGTTE
jgi:CO/xanthine dehydrogenase FAD-binding subunit